MTTHRFYVPDIDPSIEQARLSADQSRQVSRVLRLRAGDSVDVFDGRGGEYPATLVGEDGGRWTVEWSERRQPAREPELNLTVGLALIRNERFDLAVQKLTELGVFGLVPVMAERCVISYKDERTWRRRRARLERIFVEAAEQSERATLPAVDDPLTVEEFLTRQAAGQTLALVERRSGFHISDTPALSNECSLLIGPEGGWTGDEIELIDQHATPISLGDLILRSETAAIVAAGHLLLGSARTERRLP
ncbi:16S rRNA (uracil(1498)-N(3))-methyltransferase [soil metagenome]